MELVVSLAALFVGSALVGTFLHLLRGRARVVRYHDIDTPRINEMTHGGGGA